MAQRDFVKKKSKPKKSSSRVIPNLMMAIAIILVIVFVAILYIVSTNKPSKPATQPNTSTSAPETTLPEKPQERWTYLKELENPDSVNTSGQANGTQNQQQLVQERQQILDSFVNENTTGQITTTTQQNSAQQTSQTTQSQSQSTTTPSTQTSSNTNGKWSIQCGAFKDLSNAESLKAKIAMTGIESEIKSAKFHRVVIGPFLIKSQAEKTVAQLKTNGITTCIISGK